MMPIINFESKNQFLSYISRLPSFYGSIIDESIPNGFFRVNAPSGYESDFTFVYNLSNEEVEQRDISKLREHILHFAKEEEESVFFQDVHIVSKETKDFFLKRNPLVANYIHELFKYPEMIYHIQHFSLKYLLDTHFSPKDKLKFKENLTDNLKALDDFSKENCDVRVPSLIHFYEHEFNLK